MRIEDVHQQRVILKALGDEISCQILSLISKNSESVLTIVEKTKIPSSSAYRRIKELEEMGLISVKHTIYTPQGKIVKIYKSVFREITIKFKDEEIVIEAIPNNDIVEKVGSFFGAFKRSE